MHLQLFGNKVLFNSSLNTVAGLSRLGQGGVGRENQGGIQELYVPLWGDTSSHPALQASLVGGMRLSQSSVSHPPHSRYVRDSYTGSC